LRELKAPLFRGELLNMHRRNMGEVNLENGTPTGKRASTALNQEEAGRLD
jgi:hypothetical protein